MNLQDIEKTANTSYLSVYGAFHPAADGAPEGVETLVLLGPKEPGFWAHFTSSAEYADGQPHPLDRWSKRVICGLSTEFGAQPFFPFGGPPYQPFTRWATASGRAHISPVGLLVHDTAGLWVSYRGALGLRERLALPPAPPNPCLSCETRACITACPVNALTASAYDVAACKADLDRPENDCMARGCATRRACPVSQDYARSEAQSSFHMEAFR